MSSSVQALDIIQLGKESTHGTSVPATTRWMGSAMVKPILQTFSPKGQIGVLLENPMGSDTVAQKRTDITFEADLTYEQILHVLMMCMKGGVTGTGASADKTWAFAPSYTADPALESFTMDYRKAGSANWDEEITYVMGKSFEISGAIGEDAKLTCEAFGKSSSLGTAITGSIAVPTVNYVPAQLFKVYIDDTFGGLGGTQLSGDLVGFKFAFRSMAQPKQYLGDIDLAQHGLKTAGFDLELQAEYDASIDTERTKARNRTRRYVRLEAVGAVLGGSNYKITIDAAMLHDGEHAPDGDRDGNDTATMKLKADYDSTNSLAARVTVINALSTLP